MKPIGNIETLNGFQNKQGYFVYGTDEEAVTILTKASGMSGAGGALYIVTEYKEKDGVIYFKNGSVLGEQTEEDYSPCYRIRKLTPLTCWRLMGFSDEDFLAAKLNNREEAKRLIAKYEPDRHFEMMQYVEQKKVSQTSNTQLYKMAGNSIVVDVLYHIYKNLYSAMPYLFEDLKVASFFSGIGAFEKGLDRLFADVNSVG